MKRGIFINLILIFVLLLLAALPVLIIASLEAMGKANGCNLNLPNAGGVCGDLYNLAFATGLFGTVTTPLLLLILAVYLLGVILLFFLLRWRRGTSGPVMRGMLFSTLGFIGLTGLSIGIVLGVNWYQVSWISACKSLPSSISMPGVQNGTLALSVKLPEPQGTLAQYAILSHDPETGASTVLSKVPGSVDPDWSPDGSRLVFVARPQDNNNWQLMRIDAGGGDLTILLQGSEKTQSPDWSPDGQSILMQRWQFVSANPEDELYTVSSNGADLTRIPGSPKTEADARFSPDGSRIVFVSNRDNNTDIYVMNRDGSQVRRLTRHPGQDIDPAWSPDGQWIVFSSNRGSRSAFNDYNLFIMAPDGTNQCQLTRDSGSEWQPVWSPDGQWIAYIALLDSQLFRIHPDGTQPTQIPIGAEVTDLLGMDWARRP
ncbi:MAG: PD40 domain-containing protein [Anaerolineae bacterium]|nr:PD40 domain-containing protein [Anaerolineae bacterium]